MAHSRSKLRLLCLALAPAVSLAAGGLPAAVPAATRVALPAAPTARSGGAATSRKPLSINPQRKIKLEAASQELDYKTNTVVFRKVVVSQGATRVQADYARATGLNFANSRWTFRGNVQIDAPPRGSLRSDQATVDFRDNQIAGVTITGSPAQFEQRRADGLGMEKGHADQIVYDVGKGTVLLTDDAWISDGHSEMSAPSISYSIREQKVLASSSGASQGVHITITPQAAPKHRPFAGGKAEGGSPPAAGTPARQSGSGGAARGAAPVTAPPTAPAKSAAKPPAKVPARPPASAPDSPPPQGLS
jgi:lipopolysaccharide export system protein LptA